MTAPAPGDGLRKGWTTGACATAAASAAYECLLTGTRPKAVPVALPHGLTVEFAVHRCEISPEGATASVIKDAGDDPDVTHGAEIIATVTRGHPGTGITFQAGPGVGTVTRPGLPLAVGEPAINPGPRAMIAANLREAAARHHADPDLVVTVAVRNGAELARRTLNGRLGIVGGLSILGTTGVVLPYSCSAWVATIHRGVDVARAAGLAHIAGSTGRTSEDAVRRLHGLDEVALIDMGDFAGALLTYLRRHPMPRLTLAGGFAKLTKLAQGHMDLHSGRSRVDLDRLAEMAAACDADAATVAAVRSGEGAAQALALAQARGLRLGDAVAALARQVALATLAGGTAVDVVVFDRSGEMVGHAGP